MQLLDNDPLKVVQACARASAEKERVHRVVVVDGHQSGLAGQVPEQC